VPRHPELPEGIDGLKCPMREQRALHPCALRRRNWLFSGTDAGGERAAAICTQLGTAKLNGLEPEGYLRHALERIAEHPINRVDDPLPWNVALPPVTEQRLAAR